MWGKPHIYLVGAGLARHGASPVTPHAGQAPHLRHRDFAMNPMDAVGSVGAGRWSALSIGLR
ncbi:hypothetical protein STPYR_12957 [uncultured Stenotrophomonas sp.]|uniref:Uncharacterized protein n=1 Tax=uncultured Stenotrophomonas sp. TaxID=165438 RepID=A0A1Y5QC14_9GAMM|nr:hypothetical protein STPYR_12957 [uncultured Stenotrophomonas sp.]